MIRIFIYGFFIVFFSILSFVVYKYIKPGSFKLKQLIPILFFFAVLIYFDLRGVFIEYKFIKNEVHSKITDSFEWKPRVFEFTLDNNIKISSTYGDFDLQIGDSIVKKANTSLFDVYRKDLNGQFVFLKGYNYNK